MGLCHGPGVLERSGPTWGVLDFSGLFWGALRPDVLGSPGAPWSWCVLGRSGENLTLQKAVYAAYRVCADAHLGVLGRFGAFWSGAFWGALRRPGAFWDRSEAFWHRSEAAFYGVLGGGTQNAPGMCYV